MQACYNKLSITKIDGTESESAHGDRKRERKESERAYKCVSQTQALGPVHAHLTRFFSAHKLTLSFPWIGIIQ